MYRNQKLTPIIKGRTITRLNWDGPTVLLHFDDGAALRIHTSPAPSVNAPPSTVGKVKAVRQSADSIAFDLESGSTLMISLAESSSCVMLRDAKGVLVYAD